MASQELLPLGPDVQAVSTVSSAFTPPLKDLLKSATDAKDAVRLAKTLPWAMDECRRVNERVQRLMQPVGLDGVYVALQPCLILFGTPDLSDAKGDLLGVWLSLYQTALRDLPKESLEYAVSDWIANGKPFFPKPTELRDRAKRHAAAIGQLAWRCRKVAEAAEESHRAVETEEERARGRELVRETLAAMQSGHGLRGLPKATPARSRAEVAEELRRAAQ